MASPGIKAVHQERRGEGAGRRVLTSHVVKGHTYIPYHRAFNLLIKQASPANDRGEPAVSYK